MEQLLFDTVYLAVPWLPIIAGGAALAGQIFGGGGGDKKRAEALQNEAISQERQRQDTLEGRFEAMRPLRRQSLTNMLAMGSTENPFSRALSGDQQGAIMSQIDASQAARGMFGNDADRLSSLTRGYSDIYEEKVQNGREGFGGIFDRLNAVVKMKKNLMTDFGLSEGQAEKLAKEFIGSGDVSAIANLQLPSQQGGGAIF